MKRETLITGIRRWLPFSLMSGCLPPLACIKHYSYSPRAGLFYTCSSKKFFENKIYFFFLSFGAVRKYWMSMPPMVHTTVTAARKVMFCV